MLRLLVIGGVVSLFVACAVPYGQVAVIPAPAGDAVLWALADTAVAMVERDDPCNTIDQTLTSWAQGVDGFSAAVGLGASLTTESMLARVAHKIADIGVTILGAAGAIYAVEQLGRNDEQRDFGKTKVAAVSAGLLKLFDGSWAEPVAEDAKFAVEAGKRFERLQPMVQGLPDRVLDLRNRCQEASFEADLKEVRLYQLALINDFIEIVDMVPSRYVKSNEALFAYRERARQYQVDLTTVD